MLNDTIIILMYSVYIRTQRMEVNCAFGGKTTTNVVQTLRKNTYAA